VLSIFDSALTYSYDIARCMHNSLVCLYHWFATTSDISYIVSVITLYTHIQW